MKTILHPLLLIAVTLYLLKILLFKMGIHIQLVQNYLGDLLCMPVVLTCTLWFQRHITTRNPDYQFTIYHVLVAVALYSVLFEWILPNQSPKYTADLWDVVAYSLGGIIFYFGINGKKISPAQNKA